MKRILFVLLLAAIAMPALGAPVDECSVTGKSVICHFDSDYGMWVAISISNNAVGSHFLNHDDGFPTQVTSITGTYLDENCEEVGLPFCGDCLVDHAYPGCEVDTCESLICGYDPYCCDVNWDSICAAEAQEDCFGYLCQ